MTTALTVRLAGRVEWGAGSPSAARSVMVACDSAPGRRDLVLGNACPALRRHVRGYCGYFESGTDVAPRVEFSSEIVGLIIGFGPPVGIAYPRHRSGSTARVTSFVAGLHDSYAVAESTGLVAGGNALRQLVLLKGRRYVSLACLGPADSLRTPEVERFFKSLRLGA